MINTISNELQSTRDITPEEVSKHVLDCLIRSTNKVYNNDEIRPCVLTIPAYFDER